MLDVGVESAAADDAPSADAADEGFEEGESGVDAGRGRGEVGSEEGEGRREGELGGPRGADLCRQGGGGGGEGWVSLERRGGREDAAPGYCRRLLSPLAAPLARRQSCLACVPGSCSFC